MPALVTPDELTAFGYSDAAAAKLMRASARVRGYLRCRASASGLFADPSVVPEPVAEIVCAVASRMAQANPQVEAGVRSETTGGLSTTFGAEAFAGTSGLTRSERDVLDSLYPPALRTAEL